jgi:hypothetical protein
MTAVATKIVEIVPADSGWRAVYEDPNDPAETEIARVAAWALVETVPGEREVVGLVAEGKRLIPASEAGTLLRYGYKT